MQTHRNFIHGPLSSPCPFHVDDFSGSGSYFFLSHAHADHLSGLSNTWAKGIIYCTAITQQIGDVKHIANLNILTVTVLPANHYAGSCMFLFESAEMFPYYRVLHTGDFRFEHKSDIPAPLLVQSSKPIVAYVDNTFGLRSHPTFPSRSEVLDRLLEAVNRYPSHTLFHVLIPHAGKEELLIAMANLLQSKVWVDADRFAQIAIAFPLQSSLQLFTTNDQENCRIYCNPSLRRLAFSHHKEVVNIRVSGRMGMQGFLDLQRANAYTTHLRVPYSLHCSRIELIQFLTFCQFAFVIPTVYCSRADLSHLGDHFNQTEIPRISYQPPPLPSSPYVFQLSSSFTLTHQDRLDRKKARLANLYSNSTLPWTEEEVSILLKLKQLHAANLAELHQLERDKLQRSAKEIQTQLTKLFAREEGSSSSNI